jgi:ABC-type glycerol-3-phosphate transport system substrate-binding protein
MPRNQPLNKMAFNSKPKSTFRLAYITVALIAFLGCVDSSAEKEDTDKFKKAAPDPLTVLVIGETSIGPKLQRQWKSRMDGDLTVVDQLESEWRNNDFSIGADVDLIIYPTTFIGELAESGKIAKVDYKVWNSDEIDKGSYLDHYARSIVRHGNQPMAIPLGNPHWSMLLDRSKFSDLTAKNVDPISMPKTWSELKDSVDKLQGKVELPLAEGWAGHALLCRSAPNVRTVGSFSVLFDRATMKPQVASPPFVEALESLKSMATENSLNATPDMTFQAVHRGEAVAALGWPAKANPRISGDDSASVEQRGSLVLTTVPGENRIYDFRRKEWKNQIATSNQNVDVVGFSGLIASMVADNRREYSAIEFLKWVSDSKIILSVLTDSPKTGPVRVNHLGNIGKWTGESVSLDLADEYAAVVREVHQRNLVVLFPRIPGSHRYYASLDAGVRSALSGKLSSQQALDSVAKQWEEITDSIGRKKQIEAMRRESGF